MAVITVGAHPKAMWPGIHAWFGRSYDELPVQHTDLFDSETSEKNYEEDVETTGFGLAPVKDPGMGIHFDSEQQASVARYTHVAYALGYIVTYEELQDNLYEIVSKRRSAAIAFSMRQTKENVAAQVYNRAFDSNYTGGDGSALCVSTHSTVAGNQSNVLTTASDISEAAIEDMCVQIMGAQNQRGLNIGLQAVSLHVSRQQWFEANRILKSVLQNDTANNATNALKVTGALPGGIKVNTYFTDTDAWFMRTNCPNGLKHFTREGMSFTQDNDFDTKNAKAASYERYSVGWTDFRSLYGTPGA